MTQWWLASWRRAKRAPALRAPLHLEALEERNLLAPGLVSVPSPQVSGGSLVGAAAIAANDIWAVGSQSSAGFTQAPLAEHFDGTSWSVVSTPSPTSGSVLKGVAGAASNDVWAVGSGGTNNATLIEHWNGANWSEVASPTMPTGSVLKGVTAPASNNAWAVGTNSTSNNALVEHWDGTSWSVVSSPAFAGVTILSLGGMISADSTTDVWVVGGQADERSGAPFNGPVALHWDGQTWSVMSGAQNAESATALSPTNVWGAGFRGEQFHDRTIHLPVVVHWDGTSWSIVPSPNPNGKNPIQGSQLEGIAAISATDIWAVGFNEGSTLTEHWDGTSWKVVNSPNPGQSNFLAGVTALSDGTVAAVGNQFSSTTGTTPLILQNSWHDDPRSATSPAAPSAAMPAARDAVAVDQLFAAARNTAAQTRTTPAPLDAALVGPGFAAAAEAGRPLLVAGQGPAGTPTAAQGGTMPAPQDARAPNPFFAAAGTTDQPLSLTRHSSPAHPTAEDSDVDASW
jgi:hypothetical protein